MKKLWMVPLLLLSASSTTFATEKADFTLKWREEPKKETITKNVYDEPVVTPQIKTYRPNMVGLVDRANRQRVTDPNFSTYNSDPGSSVHHTNRH